MRKKKVEEKAEESESKKESGKESKSRSDSDEHTETLASDTPKKRNLKSLCLPLRRLVAPAIDHFRKMIGAKMIAAYAVYNIVFGLGAMTFVICFSSVTDVGFMRLKQAWVIITSLILLAMVGMFGFAVAMLRSVKLSKIYFWMMPLYVLFGVPPTCVMVALHCQCHNFAQCNALKSFAAASGQTYTNPFPAPQNVKQFAGLLNVPWRMPPKSASLIEQRSVAHNVSCNSSQKQQHHNMTRNTSIPKKETIASCLIDHLVHSKQAELIVDHEGNSVELIHDVDLATNTAKMSTSALSTNGTNTLGLSKGRREKKFHPTDPRSKFDLSLPLAAGWDHMSEFREHISYCNKFVRSLHFGSAMWKKMVQCRKSSVDPSDHQSKCPAEVESEMQDCALSKACGALKMTAIKGIGGDTEITIESCRISIPVRIVAPEIGKGSPHDDDGPYWNDLSQTIPLAFYFKKTKVEFETGLADIRYQEVMKHEQWVSYMAAFKDSQCTCQNSCQAYQEEGGTTGFWCKVAEKDKNKCKGMLETGTSGFLWSKKLCETTPTAGQDLNAKEPVIANVKAQCACAPNQGFKMEGAEKKLIREDILQAAQKARIDSVLVGHKCSQWMKKDKQNKRRWCVVGFDSACADREEKVISLERHLRVWVSSIPCEMEHEGTTAILSDAAGHCSRFRICWHFFDWPKYIVWPFMWFAIYSWSLHRCRDGGGSGESGNERESGWGRGDSGSSSYSGSGLSSGSECEENSDSEKSPASSNTKRESQSKANKTQKRDLQSSKTPDDSKPKKPAHNKESEWSEPSDDEKPSKKEMKKEEMEDEDDWMNAAVEVKPKKKKKKSKKDEEFSFW